MTPALLEELALVCRTDADGIQQPYAWPPRPPLSDDERRERDRLLALSSRMYYRAQALRLGVSS